MQLNDSHFQVLDTLDRHEISTQRQLAESSGISLGQANYVIKSLLERGLVKIGNFRKNPKKIGYMYLLTPKGLEAKSSLAAKFVLSRLRQYHDLRERLRERLATVEKDGIRRVVFVGPEMVKDVLLSVIHDEGLDLRLVGEFRELSGLKDLDPGVYDVALVLDGLNGLPDLGKEIPRKKLTPLW